MAASGLYGDKPYYSSFAASCSGAFSDMSNPPLLMLTGNMRSRSDAIQTVQTGAAQLCGFGRPSAVAPALAAKILDASVPDGEAVTPMYKIKGGEGLRRRFPVKLVGSSVESFYHSFLMARIGRGLEPDLKLNFWSLLIRHMWGFRPIVTVFVLVLGVPLIVLLCAVLIPPLFLVWVFDQAVSWYSPKWL